MALGTPVTASAYGAPKVAGGASARQRVGNTAQTNAVPSGRDSVLVGTRSPGEPPSAMVPAAPPAPRSWIDRALGVGRTVAELVNPYTGPGNIVRSLPTVRTAVDEVRNPPAPMGGLAAGAAAGAAGGYGSAAVSGYQDQLDDAMRRILAQQTAYGASYAAQQELLRNMGDIEGRRYTSDAMSLQEQIARQRALLGGDEYRTVGLGREANDAMIAQAHDLARRQNELLGKDWEYLLKQKGFAGSARDLALGYYDQVHGLALGANEAQFDQANRSAMSRAAATGSYMARGYGDTLSDNWGEKARGDQAAGASRDYNRGQATGQYDRTIAGLDDSWNQRDARYQQDRAEYAATLGKAERTGKYLDSLAKDYGVRAGALDDSLKRGLERLGIDHAQAIEQLNLAIAGKDTERMAQIDALMQQALSVAASAPAGTRVNPSMLGAAGGSVGGNVGASASSGFTDYTSGFRGSTGGNVTYTSGGVRRF